MNHYANHGLVTAVGAGFVLFGLTPVLFPDHVRHIVDSSQAGSLLVGLFIGGAALAGFGMLCISMWRGLACVLAAALLCSALYIGRHGMRPFETHPHGALVLLALLALAVGGGMALFIVGVNKESVV